MKKEIKDDLIYSQMLRDEDIKHFDFYDMREACRKYKEHDALNVNEDLV